MGKLGLVQGLFLLPKVLKSKWNHQKNPESVWTLCFFWSFGIRDVILFGQTFRCPGVVKPPVFIEAEGKYKHHWCQSESLSLHIYIVYVYIRVYVYVHVQLVWYHLADQLLWKSACWWFLGSFTMAKTQGQRIAEAEGRWSSAEPGTSWESKETSTRKQVKTWIPCILIGCIHLNLYKLLFISIHFCLGNLAKVIFEAINLVWKVCPFILNQWQAHRWYLRNFPPGLRWISRRERHIYARLCTLQYLGNWLFWKTWDSPSNGGIK